MSRVKKDKAIGYRNDAVTVKHSAGRGRGVFAVRNIKEGEIIEIALVLEIEDNEMDVFWITNLQEYLFESCDGKTVLGLGYASLYNHSFNPNAVHVSSSKAICFKAGVSIKKDEEIFIDYGWDEDTYTEHGISLDGYTEYYE